MAKKGRREIESSESDGEGGSRKPKARPARFIRPTTLRIIGGELRRRNVLYHGDLATRPMKDNVRENLFNILGKAVHGTTAWDLFAGTGVLGIEAISRGSTGAVSIDLSRNSVRWIRESASRLGIEEKIEVLCGDTFRIVQSRFKTHHENPMTVFCCPPYRMWETHLKPLLQMIRTIAEHSPEGSFLVCESDPKFDQGLLPDADWDFRNYGNVRLAFCELTTLSRESNVLPPCDRESHDGDASGDHVGKTDLPETVLEKPVVQANNEDPAL